MKAYEEHIQSISSGHWDALRKAISSDADEQAGVAKALIKEYIYRTKIKGLQYIGLHTADFMESACDYMNGLDLLEFHNS